MKTSLIDNNSSHVNPRPRAGSKAKPNADTNAAEDKNPANSDAAIAADNYKPGITPCDCPVRTMAPDPPTLDQDIKLNLVEELKQIILNHYRSSTFNTCTPQPLPMMHGPPLKLHVDPAAKP